MSASFLVDAVGRIRLLAIGEQHVNVRGGRFEYRGGRIPAPTPVDEGPARAAVASVPGLRGFVGVDFLWDEARDRLTVLEINPRVTTSYVGLRTFRAYAHDRPGIAMMWCVAAMGDGFVENPWTARVARGRPVAFAADGTIERLSTPEPPG